MSEVLAVILIVVAALALRAAVAGIMRYLTVEPTDPESRSSGFRDIRHWLERRRSNR
jgi:hypothetical protein